MAVWIKTPYHGYLNRDKLHQLIAKAAVVEFNKAKQLKYSIVAYTNATDCLNLSDWMDKEVAEETLYLLFSEFSDGMIPLDSLIAIANAKVERGRK